MTDGPVVVNAGPLIALSLIGSLDLLEQLYGPVLVPEAVFAEVVTSGAGRAGAREVATSPWLQRVVADPPPDPFLARELGPGEAAVITVATARSARLVILDERRARRVAEHAYGLRVKGSAGVLVAAKRAGLIPAVRPLLEAMSLHGYFLSGPVVERACQEAGEKA